MELFVKVLIHFGFRFENGLIAFFRRWSQLRKEAIIGGLNTNIHFLKTVAYNS